MLEWDRVDPPPGISPFINTGKSYERLSHSKTLICRANFDRFSLEISTETKVTKTKAGYDDREGNSQSAFPAAKHRRALRDSPPSSSFSLRESCARPSRSWDASRRAGTCIWAAGTLERAVRATGVRATKA